MGTIEKYALADGSSRWRVRWCAGSQRMKKDGFKKEIEAKRFLSRKESEKYDRTHLGLSDLTLRQYINSFLTLDISQLAPKTQESYRTISKMLMATDIADRKMQLISPEDIQKLILLWQKEGKKANTINHYLTFISRLYSTAIKKQTLTYNPMTAVGKLRIEKHQHKILTVQDYLKLLEACKHTYMYRPCLLGGYMGLRRGEALGLRWEDIDFKRHTLTIRQTRLVVESEEIVGRPKSETSERTLFLPDAVYAGLISARGWGYVCTHTDGTPLSLKTFTRAFQRVCKKAGIEGLRFHDLRHTCAAFLTEAGAGPKEVSEYLGHAGIAITMDLYADIFDRTKSERASALDRLLSANA